MKFIYVSSLLAMIVIMLVMGQRARHKNSDLAKSLVRLTYAVTVTVLTSILAITVPSVKLALFMQSLHYASMEWLLIFLLAFLERYVGVFEGNKYSREICFICSAISSINLLLNAVFGHVVYCTDEISNGYSYRVFHTLFPWYGIHLAVSYTLTLFCLIIIIHATIKTISFYRIKYIPAVFAFALTICLEIFCSINNAKMDYALYGYVWLAMFLIYYTVYHVYRGLITSTLSYVTSDSHSGVVCFSIDDKCIYANDIAWKVFNEANELSDFEKILKNYKTDVDSSDVTSWDFEKGKEKDKRYYNISYGTLTDKHNDYIGYYYYVYDKTQDVKNYEEANYRLMHDKLTDLPNSDYFYILVKDRLFEKEDASGYIIAADIKDFKLINDLYGYNLGSNVLAKFAQAMVSSFNENSIPCRLNSDRFVFYVEKDDYSEEKIKSNLQPLAEMLDKDNFQFICHFGVYEVQPGDFDSSVMYDHARLALLSIKADYAKEFAYYDTTMMNRLVREKELVGEFDRALDEKQFAMYLQPQIRTDGQVVGGEALVRWFHPEKGTISPGEFISVFEKAGLIHKLDIYMWERAAAKIKEWQAEGKTDYYISVNISPKDFYYTDVFKTIVSIVEKYDISPKQLKLEITESSFMYDPEKQLELIEKLQKYGFEVEIDDFGSGYSSLNMLKDMKANVLKIDMGFLRKTTDSDRAKAILDVIIELAHKLNMVVITEGVETEDQVYYLTEAGCDIFQGYFFDKPLPVAEFEEKYMK